MTRSLALCALLFLSCDKDGGSDSTPTSPTTGGGTAPCNPTTIPPVAGDPLTIPLAGSCPLADAYGGFNSTIYDIYSLVSGEVRDGVVPITVHEQVGAEGNCVLLRRNNPFCDPACLPSETCDFDGQCLPYPLAQDVGPVTLAGMVQDIRMTAVPPGNNYFYGTGAYPLPHPAFEPGALLELDAQCVPFTLHGVGVEQITLPNPDWIIREGDDLPIDWTPPTIPINPAQHVQVRLNIDQHGNTPVQVFCEFPDTGSAVMPASIIDLLLSFGVTGFPNATVTRRTVDSMSLPAGGCVEFVVSSLIDPNVLVEGYIPCIPGGTVTCPSGLSCDPYIGLCT